MHDAELFPREIISNLPRVTMTGQNLVYIEQHQGLVGYQPQEVSFRTSCGRLNIVGEDMAFRLYTATEAMLEGKVTGLSLTEGSLA